jgi:A/G-specific adenine glycosylase
MPTQVKIAPALLRWYDRDARVLPWRGPNMPAYRVWLSEIMLQQTTVAAVTPYYKKFLARWPTVEKLAAAKRDDVLQAWAGLGYYSRARNLHACAQLIVTNYGGQFPKDEAGLRALPGIGPYTAAAIAAIAYGQPANAVDGNVERVMSRLFALKTPLPKLKAEVKAVAAPLVPHKRAGDYAQALMDLGATICTPRRPNCPACPLKKNCLARGTQQPEQFPVRATKKARPIRHAIAFLLTDSKGNLWLRHRPDTGLLAGMIEVPSSPWLDKKPQLAEVIPVGLSTSPWQPLRGQVIHVFSHFELQLALFTARCKGTKPAGLWVNTATLKDIGLPSLTRKIIEIYEKNANKSVGSAS